MHFGFKDISIYHIANLTPHQETYKHLISHHKCVNIRFPASSTKSEYKKTFACWIAEHEILVLISPYSFNLTFLPLDPVWLMLCIRIWKVLICWLPKVTRSPFLAWAELGRSGQGARWEGKYESEFGKAVGQVGWRGAECWQLFSPTG